MRFSCVRGCKLHHGETHLSVSIFDGALTLMRSSQELDAKYSTRNIYNVLIEKIIAHVHRELCAVYVPQDIMNMHIVYSLSAFVDRGAYLSISIHVKDSFEYSSLRATFC